MRRAVIVPVPPLVVLRERSIGRRCSSVVQVVNASRVKAPNSKPSIAHVMN
jgi:hypothetical protein